MSLLAKAFVSGTTASRVPFLKGTSRVPAPNSDPRISALVREVVPEKADPGGETRRRPGIFALPCEVVFTGTFRPADGAGGTRALVG